jgi:hypothetical protein
VISLGLGPRVLGQAVLPTERWPVLCEGVVAAPEPNVGSLFDGWRTDGGYRRSGLAEAFNVKTIGDLGRNKFFRAATALVDLAGTAK